MYKEIMPSLSELDPFINGLTNTFIQRTDIHARQAADGSYICIHKPLTRDHFAAHLQGQLTLGVYLLDQRSHTSYIVMDADEDTSMEQLISLSHNLTAIDVPTYLEQSRRGGHLWLFLPHPLSGKEARRLGHKLMVNNHLANVELFPKQDQAHKGPGSLIRLPFGVHRKNGQRYGFITPERQPLEVSWEGQMRLLSAPQKVPAAFIRSIMTSSSPQEVRPPSRSLESPTLPLSGRIKNSISALDFISQFVELTPSGQGRCPFHADDHASFAVNAEGNYWSCFAGCGGGSIIDFWMKYHACDFRTAVRELADMLLTDAKPSRCVFHR